MPTADGATDRSAGEVIDEAVDPRDGPILNDHNAFKLALFCPNVARGTTLAHVDGLLQVTWAESKRICQLAERVGLEAVIPLAKWKNNPRSRPEYDRIFDSFTWAGAVSAVTERINVFATFHVPLYPPVMAAKMVATVDHISGGRFGLNVVAGFSKEDFLMFGIVLDAKQNRYAETAEWLGLIKRIWTEDEPFDYVSDRYPGTQIVLRPQPLQKPHPVIMCAGSSTEGKAFSAAHADLNFGAFPSYEAIIGMAQENRTLAAQSGREVKVFGHGYMICADTEAQAQREFNRIVREHVDEETARTFIENALGYGRSVEVFLDEALKIDMLSRAAAGYLALPLVGTPDQIVERMALMSSNGLDGIALSFPFYEAGLETYDSRIRPLLIEAGLRRS